MRNTNKKGFTIVELVIVVAVIAILAAVMIPTFSGIIAKANLSADQKAVRDMNTVLATEFTGNDPADIKAVVDALDKNGFDVDSLSPLTKNHKFYWNEGTKTVVLVNENNEVIFPKGETLAANHKDLNEDGASFINKEVKNAADLKEALENGNDVTLTGNVANAAEIIIPAGKDVTLDLGGFKYTTDCTNAGEISQTSKYIKVSAGASLTIQNGTFEGRGVMNEGTLTIKAGTTINAVDKNGGACINNKAGGTVTIENGTVFNVPNYIAYEDVNKGGANAIKNAGTLIINGGTFKSNTDAYLIANVGGTMTINGGEFEAARGVLHASAGTMTVNGGTFAITTKNDISGWTAYAAAKDMLFINISESAFTSVNGNVIYENVNVNK